ncbi:MAG: hypothetical protein SFY92_05015, partial [Verrucomicrobiae bacterium]|nr:hypothetical protein [Verrucomicrobiae bacterium]
MPPSSDSPDPSPGFFRRFWPWMVWGVFGLIVLTTVGIVSLRLYLRSQIEQEYAKIKAEGYPLTLDDLEKLYPPIPDEENRAVIYRKILPSLHPLPPKFDFIPILGKSSKKQMPFPKRGEPVPPELQSLIAEFSADFQPQYELIKLAHTRPHTRFDLKISDGSTMNFKEVLEVRRLVNFLKIKTLHACQNKNPEEAADLL